MCRGVCNPHRLARSFPAECGHSVTKLIRVEEGALRDERGRCEEVPISQKFSKVSVKKVIVLVYLHSKDTIY